MQATVESRLFLQNMQTENPTKIPSVLAFNAPSHFLLTEASAPVQASGKQRHNKWRNADHWRVREQAGERGRGFLPTRGLCSLPLNDSVSIICCCYNSISLCCCWGRECHRLPIGSSWYPIHPQPLGAGLCRPWQNLQGSTSFHSPMPTNSPDILQVIRLHRTSRAK